MGRGLLVGWIDITLRLVSTNRMAHVGLGARAGSLGHSVLYYSPGLVMLGLLMVYCGMVRLDVLQVMHVVAI
jgi:hypothetical protein